MKLVSSQPTKKTVGNENIPPDEGYNPELHSVGTEQSDKTATRYKPPLPAITIVIQILSDKNPPKDKNATEKQEILPNEMTSAWRVMSFFCVIFVLPTILISVPLYARYYLYSAKTLYFTDGDMSSLHQDVSTFWCKGQKVFSNGTFEAFVTPQPKRLKRDRRTMDFSSDILLMEDDVEEWGFYLIKGSTVSFNTCSRWPGGSLLVVKGEENLRRCFYREDKFYETKDEKAASELEERKERNKGVNSMWKQDSQVMVQQDIDIIEDSEGGEVFDTAQDEKEFDLKLIKKNHQLTKKRLKTMLENELKNSNNNETRKMTNGEQKMHNESVEILPATMTEKQNTTNDSDDTIIESNDKYPDTMIGVSVNRGSFFYNLNDTLDVTYGNSSFSSSEEFLSQCTDTIFSIELSPYINCHLHEDDAENSWNFTVSDSDFYYFIFYSDNSIEANIISFRLEINRALYDVSVNYTNQECTNSSECIFPLKFMQSAGVILDYSSNTNVSKLEDLKTYKMIAICEPRYAVYTVLILLVPFIIFVFAFR